MLAIAFYILAAVTVVSGALVITARNPVHSVLFLILAFFSAAGLFVLMGAEFLAMLLVVVYVGAVAVLFLFVVMMLDVDFTKLRQGFANYLPIGMVVGILLLIELIMISSAVAQRGAAAGKSPQVYGAEMSNIEAIGRVLYTDYVYVFQAAGLVLLVAMIGAIVLTLQHRTYVKRQDIHTQVTRRRKDAVAIVKVKTGEGIKE
ncbi:NADH-quinone oxidoreductase subunit J [Asticcacaulis sp. DW145]|jgi:NADH-quinone oxidoreductase subunit J|uniref:NADH-quinone oxidoreductase subunit J n=1 Tax=Asticcacaulis currens TaxID=2984210 RepID=A0ABT5IIJ1_9CAUL|nr:NADH-quinone oxidoreductase subunit J [Asticcacaulis currens]MDC7695979.1 NADH-quinone oxidoreductase subunit J [Asticcacaulis currens]BEV12314.1 NADH-quinone oxidoreductase subunit J [Asticcacaulis sp. DW145]